MNISVEVAKILWKDDDDMMKKLELNFDKVSCMAEIDDDLTMTLTPMRLLGFTTGGISGMGSLDGNPIGQPIEVGLLLAGGM